MNKNIISDLTLAYNKNKNNYDALIIKFNSNNINDTLLDEIFSVVNEIDPINGANVMFKKLVRSGKNTSNSIKKMMELGVDSDYYSDALHYCFTHKDIDFAKYLVENLAINVNNFSFEGISFNDCNNPDLVKILLDYGLKLSANTRVFYRIPNTNIIKLFLDYGVDINEILKFNTPQIDKRALNLLIEEIKKSNCTIKKEYLDQILLINYEISELSLNQIITLVDAGANPRINDDYPFITACSYCDLDVVKYFLYECGCDINVRNSDALTVAIAEEHYVLAKFLIECGIKITDNTIRQCLLDVKTLPLLLNANIDAVYIGKILWSDFKNSTSESESYQVQDYAAYMRELVKHGVDFNKIILG